jgi:hypothetical protein
MTLTEPTKPVVETWKREEATGPALDCVLETTSVSREGSQAWQTVIDTQLLEWANDPQSLEDDGLEAPSREVIHLACRLCHEAMQANMRPPDRVVPDGDGGVSMEWRFGHEQSTVTWDILRDCTVEKVVFSNGQVTVQTL